MAKAQVGQGCLFEQDFLRRTLGAIANTPEIALTELVANAWDAGASNVQIALPEEIGEFLRIEDDGTGMSASDFRRKWMTLGYDRVNNQGKFAEFPPGREESNRPAYGRNGVGRHGMLCFASEYEVRTRKDGIESNFMVETSSGKDPFRIVKHESHSALGNGTILRTPEPILMTNCQKKKPRSSPSPTTCGCSVSTESSAAMLGLKPPL